MLAHRDAVLVGHHVRLGGDLGRFLQVGRQIQVGHVLVLHQVGSRGQIDALVAENFRRHGDQDHHHQVHHDGNPEGFAQARAFQIIL